VEVGSDTLISIVPYLTRNVRRSIHEGRLNIPSQDEAGFCRQRYHNYERDSSNHSLAERKGRGCSHSRQGGASADHQPDIKGSFAKNRQTLTNPIAHSAPQRDRVDVARRSQYACRKTCLGVTIG